MSQLSGERNLAHFVGSNLVSTVLLTHPSAPTEPESLPTLDLRTTVTATRSQKTEEGTNERTDNRRGGRGRWNAGGDLNAHTEAGATFQRRRRPPPPPMTGMPVRAVYSEIRHRNT